MAKVMISLPDDVLARVDAAAERRSMSRSAVIRECVSASFDARRERLTAVMRELNDDVTQSRGGDVVADLKASRAMLDR